MIDQNELDETQDSIAVQKLSRLEKARKAFPKLYHDYWPRQNHVWLPRRALKKKSHPSGLPVVLGRMGTLEVRLATTKKEIRRAQRLRYQVFYEEMGAIPSASAILTRKDSDPFDLICDHLLVVDYASTRKKFRIAQPEIVGTYRLLRHDVAMQHGGFYSQSEFDLSGLLQNNRQLKFLELGRSCVVENYRGKRIVELLWKGIWRYLNFYQLDAMIGCASIQGTSVKETMMPLEFLKKHAQAPEEWKVQPLEHRKFEYKVPKDLVLDEKLLMKNLPPLIKGYLRLGAYVSHGAVVDHQFQTTDIFIVLPIQNIQAKYLDYYT